MQFMQTSYAFLCLHDILNLNAYACELRLRQTRNGPRVICQPASPIDTLESPINNYFKSPMLNRFPCNQHWVLNRIDERKISTESNIWRLAIWDYFSHLILLLTSSEGYLLVLWQLCSSLRVGKINASGCLDVYSVVSCNSKRLLSS